jgi:hypothetical protein
MKRFWLAVVVLIPALSFAQAGSTPVKVTLEDKKGTQINEIERGFYLEGRGGFWGTINPPVSGASKRYFSAGQAVELDVGFDIGERVSPSLFLLASANRMGSDYTGLSGGAVSGDYGALVPGVGVKVRIVGFDDAQSVKRSWFYVRVAGGVVLYNPSALLNALDVFISAGPGLEYFTKLRHFSIGVEANFNFMALTQSVGFSVLPMVKYSF